ncbi:MAG: response regulator [Chryseolinea sp.]
MNNTNESIFLADDDEDDCVLFQSALREVGNGIELIISYDGKELMETLDKRVPPPPHVIFLDLNMPRKNGMECLQEIRQTAKFKDIPVIIFSTSSQENSIYEAYANGASHYITKPGTFTLLKKIIQKVLAIDWSKTPKIPFEKFLLQP